MQPSAADLDSLQVLLSDMAYKLTRLEAWARRIDPEGFDAADADTTRRVLRFGARQRLDDVGLGVEGE